MPGSPSRTTTGAASSCSARLLHGQTLAASPLVSQSVWELASEVNVPLLRDVRFARSLSVTGAARYTNYQTVGSYWTWKLGASWELNDEFRVRGALSRDRGNKSGAGPRCHAGARSIAP